MKTFRRMIHKGLETQKAMELLNMPIDNFETKVPVLPSGGEIFLYRTKSLRDIDSWRKDGYRWSNRGTSVMTINRSPALRKSFFYLITREGQNNGFQKHVYRLFDSENKVVIHYLGDETLHTNRLALTKEPKKSLPFLLPSTLKEKFPQKVSGTGKKPETSEVCSNHFVDGCPTIMNPLPTLNIEPPPKDKESKKKSTNSSKLASKSQKSIIESLFIKAQGGYQEQQQNIMNLETLKSTLQRSPNKVLEQLQYLKEISGLFFQVSHPHKKKSRSEN